MNKLLTPSSPPIANMALKDYKLSYVLLCVIGLAAMFSTSLVNPLLSIFAKQLGAAGVMIGLSVAGYWIARVLLEIPSGFISAKYGYYWPMLLGLVLTTLGTFWNAFVTDPIQLILARALQGLGAPLFFAVSMTFIVNMFSTEKRGAAMGIFQGIEFGGSILGSTFSGYLITMLGFQGGFFLSTLLCAIAVVLLALPPYVRHESAEMPKIPAMKFSTLPKVFKNKILLIVSFATFMEFILSNGVIYTVYPLYANESLGMSLTDIGLIMGARSIGYVIAMLIMGSIADKIGRKPVLLFGIASTAVMTVILNFASGIVMTATILFCIGITTGAIWIVCPVIAAEAVEAENRGAAIGTYRTFFDLGSIFGPIIMTYIMGIYGPTPCFYLAAILLAVAFVPCLKITETKTGGTVVVH
jgi:MFS family permease